MDRVLCAKLLNSKVLCDKVLCAKVQTYYSTLFVSLMEAGTNDNLGRLDLHSGTLSLLPDGRVSYSGKSGCWELEIIFFAFFPNCLLIHALYRLIFFPHYDFHCCFVHAGQFAS